MKITRKISGAIFGILAMGIGLYPLKYLLSDGKIGILNSKTDVLLADIFWNVGFYAHIILGGLALFVGWIQFNKKIRIKKPRFHRRIGKVYVIAAIISGSASIYIAYFAAGGFVASLGFTLLGATWLYTTIRAFKAIKAGKVTLHQQFMIYSYAACFAAVTLRIWLPILITLHDGSFIPAYRIVAWLCWVPNIIVAYFIAQKATKVAIQ